METAACSSLNGTGRLSAQPAGFLRQRQILPSAAACWPVAATGGSVAAAYRAHRAPVPEEEPLPGESPEPEEDPVPHPDPVIREPADTPPPEVLGAASTNFLV